MVSEKHYPSTIADEFQNAPLSDRRLITRLSILASDLGDNPEKSIPDACGELSKTKAAYDFFENKNVHWQSILAPHVKNTIERCKQQQLVLLIQDTTPQDFSTLHKTTGLGPYSTKPKALGLLMHSVLAINQDGVPLGLPYLNIWSRENYPKQKRHQRYQLPIQEKESNKWLLALEESSKLLPKNIKRVTIADRESDIYEFFKKAIELEEHLVIRATHNRRITGEHRLLYEQIEQISELGQCLVDIPRDSEKNLPPRQAKLSIRYCPVNVCQAHARTKNPESVSLYAVYAIEIDAPQGEEPIEWLLLTTLPVTDVTEAVQKIKWYRERWKIERFHFTLKSGCKVEELQFETAERLIKAITLYAVIAWYLLWLTYQARSTPHLSCEVILEKTDWQILYCVANKTKAPPEKPPTLEEVVLMFAKLGGFLGRKGDGNPGVKVIWRGFQKFNQGLMIIEFAEHLLAIPKVKGND